MHRSGTSAMTRMLNLLGCNVASDLVEADQFNERGYWESRDIAGLNEAALQSAGGDWSNWEPFDQKWCVSDKRKEFHANALNILTAKFGKSDIFVLKDPRICRLLPFWLDVLKDFGAQPLIVSPIRNPAEVAMSLLKRNGMNPALAQLLWLRHVLDAELCSRGTLRLFTSYENLLSDWRSLAKRIENAFGDFAWPRSFARSGDEIDAFLSPDLRHHKDIDTSVVADFSPWVRGVWTILGRWAAGRYEAGDEDALDHIRMGFDESSRTFAQPIMDHKNHGVYLASQLQGLNTRVAEADRQERLQELQGGQIVMLNKHVAELSRETETTRREVEDLRDTLADLTAQLVEQEQDFAVASGDATAARSDLAAALAEREDVENTLAEQRALAAALRRRLSDSEADYAMANEDILLLEQTLAARASDLTKTREEVLIKSRLLQEAGRSLRFSNEDVELAQGRIRGLECDLEDTVLACERIESRLRAIENSLGGRLLIQYRRMESKMASIVSKPANESTVANQ
jgi:hypothetical protein